MQRRKWQFIFVYFFKYLSKHDVVVYVCFILQSVLPARLEIIVLRIAAWLVEIPVYVTKSRAIVTEAVYRDGKGICVRMVNTECW